MAVTAETLAAQRRMRIELDALVDAATAALAAMWGIAWEEVSAEWAAAIAALIALTSDGVWPTTAQILRASRAQRALSVAADALDELSEQAGVRILSDVSQLAADAAMWTERVAQTQLPSGLSVSFSRVDDEAIAAIVKRTTEQVTALRWPLQDQATQVMKASLIRGVSIGDHPETAARIMLRRAEDGFNGGLARARNIARTEMLGAHRDSAFAFRKGNEDILKGWSWHAELSRRTCPSCLSKHGTEYPASTPGPWDHQSGRCTALPITRTWRELGFDVDEPEPLPFEAGEDWLGRQPADVQTQVLGKKGREKWLAGDWPAGQWSRLRPSTAWRDSWGVAPVPA